MNQRFILNVKGRCGFIQQDNRRVLEKCPRDGNTLPFAAGQFAAIFTDHAVPFVRQFFSEFIAVGQLCCGDDLFIRRVLIADADIFQDGIVKQRDILKDDRIQRKQGFGIDL